MKTTHAHDVEEWLDALDPAEINWKDGARLRRIVEARIEFDKAERALHAAVRDAHAGGDSWAAIGMVLGVSRQAAHRKYARPDGEEGTSEQLS